jgi:hypothetical protein
MYSRSQLPEGGLVGDILEWADFPEAQLGMGVAMSRGMG